MDVRTHFLSSPGIERGGHTMVMVNEGQWRVSGGDGCVKWSCFDSLADWGVYTFPRIRLCKRGV